MINNPAAILYNAAGQPIALNSGDALSDTAPALPIVAQNMSGNAELLRAEPNGLKVASESFLHDIARGSIPNKNSWQGHTLATLDNLTGVGEACISEGEWNLQDSAAQRSISSTSSEDSATGTGTRKVLVMFIKGSDGEAGQEVVTMDGTTPVNFVSTDVWIINGLMNIDVGAVGVPVGDISVYASTGGSGEVMIQVLAGRTGSHLSRYTVPSNKRLFCTQLTYFCEADAWFDIAVTRDYSAMGGGSRIPLKVAHLYVSRTSTGGVISMETPIYVGPGQEFRMCIINGGNGNRIAAAASGWEEVIL